MKLRLILEDNRFLIAIILLLLASSLMVIIKYSPIVRDLGGIAHLLTVHRGRHSAQEDSLLMYESADWHQFRHSEDTSANDKTGVPVVDFLFVFSRTHCGNCVRDEVFQLNRIYSDSLHMVRSVVGYSLDNPDDSLSTEFNSKYASISFPVFYSASVRDHFRNTLGQTPVLFVVDGRNNKILDVHRPIPTDIDNLNAFFERWDRILELVH